MTRSPLPHALFALALLVRGMAVPGYMSGGDGWPVQLCPQGLSSSSVALLFGPADQDHAHHHAQHSHHSAVPDAVDPAASISAHGDRDHGSRSGGLERCALGGSATSGVLPLGPATIAASSELSTPLATVPALPIRGIVSPFRARAPPLQLPHA